MSRVPDRTGRTDQTTELLKTYREKRDFERTAEPAGGTVAPHPERPLFCVQKHAATTLHYDLRLEMDGVLKSWAVPKGPSLDPAQKRLAVMTEDHPLEYGGFEGTIAEGEYGAGAVVLWDTGWWELDLERERAGSKRGTVLDVDAGPVDRLEAGEVKFILHGHKLTGSWTLVQMKGRGEKNWLLIKHRDEASRTDGDITEEAPLSVSTGRSLEDVAEGREAEVAPIQDPSSSAPSRPNAPHPTSAGASGGAGNRPPLDGTFPVDGKRLTFTNTDKVYFPEAGITKGEVLAYYHGVAPHLLPHVRDRPLTLERFPEGVEGESFYQKDAPSYYPDWLRRYEMTYRRSDKVVHHPLVDDTAGLLYLANLGTLTFHTFLSRLPDVDRPDVLVIDIDPPEAAATPGRDDAFPRAREAAWAMRTALHSYGLDPLVKTSGKRGLHLGLALAGDLSFDQVRDMLGGLFDLAIASHPALLTREARKDRRGDRVYLDALRMASGATVVAPYSIRATPMASVSMPVTWQELETLDDPSLFTVQTALERLAETGDLWAPLAPGGDGRASGA